MIFFSIVILILQLILIINQHTPSILYVKSSEKFFYTRLLYRILLIKNSL